MPLCQTRAKCLVLCLNWASNTVTAMWLMYWPVVWRWSVLTKPCVWLMHWPVLWIGQWTDKTMWLMYWPVLWSGQWTDSIVKCDSICATSGWGHSAHAGLPNILDPKAWPVLWSGQYWHSYVADALTRIVKWAVYWHSHVTEALTRIVKWTVSC